ncbi:hypothetical protein [Streptomyces sp. NPDC005141]
MPKSTHSDDSGNSNSSSYSAVRVNDDGNGGLSVRGSSQPVPDDAPQLLEGAGAGVYDQNSGDFYAVNSDNSRVAHWDKAKQTWAWLSENRGRIGKALLDVAPTLIQGASAFVPGKAGTIVNATGVAAQAGVGLNELRGQFNQWREGGRLDGVQLATSAARIGSAAMNTYAAASDPEATSTKMVGGAGNWVAGGATMTDVVHHAHTDPGRQPHQDAENQMYALHTNPQLGMQPGQYPPGFVPPTQPESSNSSSYSARSPVIVPAGSFNPPRNSTGSMPTTSTEPPTGGVSKRKQGKKPVVRGGS